MECHWAKKDLSHSLNECVEEVSTSLFDEDDDWVKELHSELEPCSGHLREAEKINVLQ